jgi:hypothetical protein
MHLLSLVYEILQVRRNSGPHYARKSTPKTTTVILVALQEVVQVSRAVETIERRGAQEEHGGETRRFRERKLRSYCAAKGVADENGTFYVQVIYKTYEAPGVAGYGGLELLSTGTIAEARQIGGDEPGVRERVCE